MKKGERKRDFIGTSPKLRCCTSCLEVTVRAFFCSPSSSFLGFAIDAEAGLGIQEAARYTSSLSNSAFSQASTVAKISVLWKGVLLPQDSWCSQHTSGLCFPVWNCEDLPGRTHRVTLCLREQSSCMDSICSPWDFVLTSVNRSQWYFCLSQQKFAIR